MPASPVTKPVTAKDLTPSRQRQAGSKSTKELIVRVVQYVSLAFISVFVLLPFVWMVLSSLKLNNEIFTVPVTWIPSEFQWHNYVDIWYKSDMANWIYNTVLIAGAVTILQVLTGSFAAYGFSRIKFPGRDVLFIIYIGTLSVPWQAYMIPQFKIIGGMIGLVDTPWAIILLQTFSAFGVFLMKQFYDTIPEELSEAARIDGLSEYGIYWRIMLPLSTASIASLAIIVFTNAWNDYMGPLLYLRDRSVWTIQLGLQTFVGEYNTDFASIMTGSVISVLPIAVVFAFGQRYFVQGIATSGLKG